MLIVILQHTEKGYVLILYVHVFAARPWTKDLSKDGREAEGQAV